MTGQDVIENAHENTEGLPHWAEPVATFIQSNLPQVRGGREWDHMYCTGYQIGCDTLIALGVAQETDRGARPIDSPTTPRFMPRWDDVSVAVLMLAQQQNLLSFKTEEESPDDLSRTIDMTAQQQIISPAHGLGAAHTTTEFLQLLQTLNLVDDLRWTRAAEQVLWREQPEQWRMNIATDPRFIDAVNRAVTEIPRNIYADLLRLVTITDEDIAECFAQRKVHLTQLIEQHGQHRVRALPQDPGSIRSSLISMRRNELDWRFFTSWRISEGWLHADAEKHALAIFHDPLAIMVRRLVIARLWPDLPQMAD